MKKRMILMVVVVLALASVLLARNLRIMGGFLDGFEEVPAISTAASGEFRAMGNNAGTEIAYELSYSGLEGDVTQAHIHVGQRGANGGISVWLCSNLASPPTPAGTQPCPQSGRISGTIRAEHVVGPAGQGVAAGEFGELLTAIRDGKAYANVHSTKFPGGEIRAQIGNGRGNDDEDDD